jgi:hypothetical protein
LTIIFFALEIPPGLTPVDWRALVLAVLKNVVVPVIVFAAGLFRSLFPWPLIALSAIGLLLWGPDRIREWLSSVNFNIAGIFNWQGRAAVPEVFDKELNEAQRAVVKANKEIADARDSGGQYGAELRTRFRIPELVGILAKDIANAVGPDCPSDFRLTLFIRDFVLEDRLYQFSEYYDTQGLQKELGSVIGRNYSTRYGVIGRVWRTGISEVEGDLIGKDDRAILRQSKHL